MRAAGWYRVRRGHNDPEIALWLPWPADIARLEKTSGRFLLAGSLGVVRDDSFTEIDERPIPVDEHPWDMVREVLDEADSSHVFYEDRGQSRASDAATMEPTRVLHGYFKDRARDEILKRLEERAQAWNSTQKTA